MPTSIHDQEGDRINVAANWLIDRVDEWAIGKLPSYQKLCRQIADNAQSIINLNRPGVNGASDVGILTLIDRIGAILRDDYFCAVTGATRLQLARHKVTIIRGAAGARLDSHAQPAATGVRHERAA